MQVDSKMQTFDGLIEIQRLVLVFAKKTGNEVQKCPFSCGLWHYYKVPSQTDFSAMPLLLSEYIYSFPASALP
jgi:hypothetical protein